MALISPIDKPWYHSWLEEEERINTILARFLGYKTHALYGWCETSSMCLLDPHEDKVVSLPLFTENMFLLCRAWNKLRANSFKISFNKTTEQEVFYSSVKPLEYPYFNCVAKINKPNSENHTVRHTSIPYGAAWVTSLVVDSLQSKEKEGTVNEMAF